MKAFLIEISYTAYSKQRVNQTFLVYAESFESACEKLEDRYDSIKVFTNLTVE